MALRDCLGEIKGAFGEAGLTDDQILEMLEEFDAVGRAAAAERPWANVQEEMFKHAQKLAKDARETALIEKRNKLMDDARGQERLADLERPEFQADPYDALTGIQIGTLGLRKRDSVAAKSRSLERHWLGSLQAALMKRELLQFMRKGVMDLPIARELWELGRIEGKGKPGITGSKEALEAAKVIHGLQERMVARLNRSGAFIRRMPGYIVRQTHDQMKLRQAGFNKWFADVQPRVDEGRTFGRFLAPDERLDAYQAVFLELQAGRHMEAMAEDDLQVAGVLKGGSLAKRVSQSRAIHFKSAEDWFAYNQGYGTGSLSEQIEGSIHNNARAVAMMETWGTNPRAGYEKFLAALDKKLIAMGKPVVGERQAPTNIGADAMWAQVSGEGNRTASGKLAKGAGMARSLQVLSKLGSAVLAALGDTPVAAHEMSRHGVNILSGYGRGVGHLVARITDPVEKQQAATMLGAYSTGVNAALADRFSGGDFLPGKMAEGVRLLFKWTGFTYWNDAHRQGVMHAFSASMAERLALGFDELPGHYREMLGAYGIDAADWVRLREAVVDVAGTRMVLPHRLKLGDTADAAGRRAARRERDALADKLETFFSDRMDSAILEPGARVNAIWRGTTQPGTGPGEFLRAIQQFKGFPTEVLARVWGERIAQSDYAGLAAVILGMTVMGHISVTARDYLKGKAQPDYANLTPQQAFSVFGRAFVTGGGAGLLGDFFVGEADRYGQTVQAAMFAAPALSPIDLIYKTIVATVGVGIGTRDPSDAGAAAFKALWTNVPGANVWWARTAFEYLFVHQMQELLNPGYLKRMERRLASDTGQRFWLRPQAGELPAIQ
jgi:hypothetical protein